MTADFNEPAVINPLPLKVAVQLTISILRLATQLQHGRKVSWPATRPMPVGNAIWGD